MMNQHGKRQREDRETWAPNLLSTEDPLRCRMERSRKGHRAARVLFFSTNPSGLPSLCYCPSLLLRTGLFASKVSEGG